MERQVERMERLRERMASQRDELAAIEEALAHRESERPKRLRDPEFEAKLAAVEALSRKSGDAQAFETLKASPSTLQRMGDARCGSSGPATIPGLGSDGAASDACRDGNTELRQMAIISLGRSGSRNDTKTNGVLAKIAEDPLNPGTSAWRHSLFSQNGNPPVSCLYLRTLRRVMQT